MNKFAIAIVAVASASYVSIKWIRPWVAYQTEERRINQQCAGAQRQMALLSDEQLYFYLTHAVGRY